MSDRKKCEDSISIGYKACRCGFFGPWGMFRGSKCVACHNRRSYAKHQAKMSFKRLYGRWPSDAEAEESIGCSFGEFRKWIESTWESWMNWGNNGNGAGKWSLDHIVPIHSKDPDCLHYINTKAICSIKNARKCDKI